MVSDTLDGTQLSILLHTLGLTDFLINQQCNRSDTPYAEAVDGWTYGKVLYIYKWNKQHKICIDQFMQNKCFVSFIGADSWQLYFFNLLFIIYIEKQMFSVATILLWIPPPIKLTAMI